MSQMGTILEVGTSRVVPLHEAFTERLPSVVQHPRFEEAVIATTRAHLANALAHRDDPGHLSSFRIILFETYLLYLHLELELFGRGVGASFVEMQGFATKIGIFGGRTVSDIIRRMIDMGRLERVPSGQDLRVRRLAPTNVLVNSHQQLSDCYLEGLSVLGMSEPLVRRARSGVQAFLPFRHRVGKAYGEGLDPVRPFGRPAPFLSNRSHGSDILSYILVKNIEAFGKPTAECPLTFNLSRMAENLGISRAHIRNVLQGLVERDLIRYEMQTSRVTLNPAMLTSHALSQACVFILYDMALKDAYP